VGQILVGLDHIGLEFAFVVLNPDLDGNKGTIPCMLADDVNGTAVACGVRMAAMIRSNRVWMIPVTRLIFLMGCI